jgi:3-methyladenine DNA glycosylase AlkD
VDLAAADGALDAELRAAGTPERAVKERAYLKSGLVHYGTTVPAMRSVVRAFRREHKNLGRADVVALAGRLWAEPATAPVHERRMLATLLLDAYVEVLRPEDLDLVERWVREARTWALVDGLAADVVGRIVEAATAVGTDLTPLLDRWAADDDVWVRRAALLSHLRALREGDGDWARFTRYADAMLAEREFWIRKAIGWILRDTSRRRPDLVYEWLFPRASRAAGLTVREAVKYLSPEQSAAVLAAHRS